MKLSALHSLIWIVLFSFSSTASADQKPCYWQQAIQYKMVVDFDVQTDQFTATQWITYTNNSPDELNALYFHLYLNAFQPGSEMDVRSRTIPDPDTRIGDRISKLSPRDKGYQKITSVQSGKSSLAFKTDGTIMEVVLDKPLRPGKSLKMKMDYEAQVPVQIRRTGRDNAEGIRYSMSQWYPKMCEYDRMGWHTDPYVAREFYGVWGSFDVVIHIDSTYTLAATGVLQNPQDAGHGYSLHRQTTTKNNTWHFKADNVHDFVWAADPHYKHDQYKTQHGFVFHTFYRADSVNTEYWEKLPAVMEEVEAFMADHFGPYPYPQFSIVQGGDGGMEYPMATLITGKRSFGSLVSVTVHEFVHSWFYGLFGFNESLYYWMDEGFTNYAEAMAVNHLREKGLLRGAPSLQPIEGDTRSYVQFATTGLEEPLSTHADHFRLNEAYSNAAYAKGSVFLNQLRYIVGNADFRDGFLRFYKDWKYRHPDPVDFMRVMEKASGLELDWYREYMVYTTKTIDYGMDTLTEEGGQQIIRLARHGEMPMPVDIRIVLTDGSEHNYTIPLDLMRGGKTKDDLYPGLTVLPEWNWVNPYYEISLPAGTKAREVILDPFAFLADTDPSDNTWPRKRISE